MPVVDYQPLAPAGTPGALVDYVSDARKAAAVRFRHLPADLSLAHAFFSASADRASANAKPIAHIAISWPIHEQPSIDEAFAYGEAFLERMGFGDQSALLAAHDDATHRHIHIMLDRVGPDGRVLAQNRIAEQLIDVRDELAREFGFEELGRNVVPKANKIETAKAFNGRFTATEYAREALRRARPKSYAEYDAILWDTIGAVRVPGKSGHRIELRVPDRTYYAKGSAIGFGPKRTKTWGPQPPALDAPPDRTPKDTYDAFLAREESLTPFAKAHPKRLEYERARREGMNVGQLGRFLRTLTPETAPMTDLISDLSEDEQHAIDEARRASAAAEQAPSTATAPVGTHSIGAGTDEPTLTNSIGGPTEGDGAAATGQPPQQPRNLKDLYRSFLISRGASEERADSLVTDAQTLIQLRRGANTQALSLSHIGRDREKFVESLREIGIFARSAHLRHELDTLYSGQAYIGIDAFANIAAGQLKTTPDAISRSLGSRATVFALDPSLASAAVLADLAISQNDDHDAWTYRVGGSGQTFEERADRRFHFETAFDTKDTRAIDAALLAAAAMHGGRVDIKGDRAFVDAAVRRAVKLGIEVTNHKTLFNELIAQERTHQAALLARRVPVRDPHELEKLAVADLHAASTSLRDDRDDSPERTPYRVESAFEWNDKRWLLLRDAASPKTDIRSATYLFGAEPTVLAQIPNGIKVGDLVGIEGRADDIAIVDHLPDAKRERDDIERQQREAQQIVREERSRGEQTR
jgi:hypothetical protein